MVHREDILLQNSSNAKASQMFGTGKYFFDVFGQPGVDKRWGWQFDGHHLAFELHDRQWSDDRGASALGRATG